MPELKFNNLVFNMNNELAIEYNVINVCDKSSNPSEFLSSLIQNYYLVIETSKMMKYVIAYGQKEKDLKYLKSEPLFKVIQIRTAGEFDNEYFNKHRLNSKTVLAKDLRFDEIVFGENSIKIANRFEIEKPISFKFYRTNENGISRTG